MENFYETENLSDNLSKDIIELTDEINSMAGKECQLIGIRQFKRN